MITTFTSNDVLRYFYGDISKAEKENIEEELAFNEGLQDMYCEIDAVSRVLNNTTISPDQSVVDNILLYSKTISTSH